ncbi:MAG: DNA polymerase III subunit alpha [Mycetocola sp.]
MNFPHLHVHSAYSMHYGVTMPERLAEQAAAQGADFLAVTDRDGLYGAIKHIRACIAVGVRPGLGADLAIHDDEHRPLGRVVVLAHGNTDGRGYASLCRLVSAAHKNGTKKPSVSRERLAFLAGMNSLSVLLGPASDVGQSVQRRDGSEARQRLTAWTRSMPAGSVTVEVVCHLAETGTPGSVTPATRMLSLAEHAGLPAVLTNAVRYGTPDEALTADIADAARMLTPLAELEELQTNGQAWLKSGRAMRQVARMVVDAGAHEPGAVDQLIRDSQQLAEKCALDGATDIGLGKPRMPEASVIGVKGDPFTELWARGRQGVDERYAGSKLLPEAHRALEHEMKTVELLGMAGYFLTVAHACDLIRNEGIRIQARGSGVGSVLNYVLHTSSVEPISNGLIWERFLSPERLNLPDIDIDVESAKRHDIYRMLFKEFGSERVTLLSMTNAYRGRGAVRDAGLALGMDDADIKEIAGQMWRFNARQFRQALKQNPELAGLATAVQEDQQLDMLVDLTERLDRLPRHIAVHPCGVILSDRSLLDRTAVQASEMGLPMSMYDKHDMDPLGLIKLDVLGVRMQSAMAHAVAEHRRLTGETIDLNRVPLDDEPTFELLRSTRTLGVFQLESPGQMELVGKLQPEVFNDLTVEISLFRPGPMQNNMPLQFLQARHGEAAPDYIHPRFEPFLRETMGVVVFHEQVMRMFDELTGCGLGKADVFRRHLEKPDELPAIEAYVREHAAHRGFPDSVVDQAWKVLAGFGAFGFAKAHGAAFALPTYQSAWLKTHHPAVFFAGLLTHDPGMWPKDLIIAEARSMGIPILGFDVQTSGLEYRVEETSDGTQGIRMALVELNGSSQAERARIAKHQPFDSLQDFRDRVRPKRRTFESLARVGALDSFIGYDRDRRHELLAHIQSLQGSAVHIGDDQLALDIDLPPLGYEGNRFKAVTSMELRGRTQTDLELRDLNVAVSNHQMARFHDLYRELGVTPAAKLIELPGGTEVLIAGVRRATNTPPTRNGIGRVVFLSLDDGSGPVANAVVFGDAQQKIGGNVFRASYMLIRGKTRRSGARGVSVTVDDMWDLFDVQRKVKARHQAKKREADAPVTADLEQTETVPRWHLRAV